MLKRLGFADIIAIAVRGRGDQRTSGLGLGCDKIWDFKLKREV